MFYKIENELYTAQINDMGAELHSLRSKADGVEYVWYGKPEIWYGQAPVLFPVVGQVINDRYLYQGKEYAMPKHGLARKLPFKVKSAEACEISFSLESDAATKEKYPFDFELIITYKLDGALLRATHTVINKTKGEMWFSLGAHPGFNCEIGDTIELEKPETIDMEQIDGENLVIDKKFPLLDNSNTIEITEELFKKDALILSGMKSEKLKIVSKRLGRELEFVFGKAPFLGIWAKPAAPYVCIEPWYGINDSHKPYADLSEKRGIQHLNENESFEFTWTAQPKKI